MPSILADGNVEGHLKALVRVLENTDWQEIWASLDVGVVTFDHLGVARDVSDRILWRACQQQNVILITGNRNAAGADSLEATIRLENTDSCLPVLTIANPARIYTDRAYAEHAAERLLEVHMDIDAMRGAGRVPLT